jgi:putative endonuclease
MTHTRQSLGRWGEEVAARYLQERGYKILNTNVRTPGGEIDLVAWLEAPPPPNSPPGPAEPGGLPTVVFVEVKARSTRTFGYPEESVNPRKQAHLLSAAQYYIQQHPELECHWRIDVIAIQRRGGGEAPEIVHFQNAIVS